MKIDIVDFQKQLKNKLNENLILEDLGTLAHIPPTWIKTATKRLAGENSKLVKGEKQYIKSDGGLTKFVKEVVDNAISGESAIVWVELDNEPLLGVIPDGAYGARTTYSLFTISGQQQKVSKYYTQRVEKYYRSKDDNRTHKYIHKDIKSYDSPSLNVTELIQEIGHFIRDFLKKGFEGSSDNFVFFNVLKQIPMTINSLTKDVNRLNLQKDRIDSKSNSEDTLSDVRDLAIEKMIKNQIGNLVTSISKKIPTKENIENIIENAFSGKETNLDFTNDFKTELEKLTRVVDTIKKYAKYNSYNKNNGLNKSPFSKKPSIDYTINNLLSSVKYIMNNNGERR